RSMACPSDNFSLFLPLATHIFVTPYRRHHAASASSATLTHQRQPIRFVPTPYNTALICPPVFAQQQKTHFSHRHLVPPLRSVLHCSDYIARPALAASGPRTSITSCASPSCSSTRCASDGVPAGISSQFPI